MRIDRSYRDDQILPHHFERMARSCEYPSSQLYQTIHEYLEKIPLFAEQLTLELHHQGIHHPILRALKEALQKRCCVLVKKLSEY